MRRVGILLAASLVAVGSASAQDVSEDAALGAALEPTREVAQEAAQEATPDSVPEQLAPSSVSRPMIEDLRSGREGAGLGSGAWASAGFFGGDVRNDSLILATLDVGLRLGLTHDARVTLDWGVAFAATRVRGAYTSPTTVEDFDARHGRVEGRNADLRFEWLPFVSSSVRVGIGIGAAIPVAATTRLPSDAASQSELDSSLLVHESYLAMNGGLHAWRYRPERAAVYVPLSVAIALAPETLLSIEGAGSLGFRILGGMGADLLGDLLLAVDLGTAVLPELRLGVRASVAGLDLGTSNEAAQPNVEGWTRLELAPVSVLVRANVGLGGPYGVGSNFVGWGLHAGAGVSF